VSAEGGAARFHKPVVYQEQSTFENSQRTTDHGQQTSASPKSKIQNPKLIEGRYILKSDGEITFETAPYDRAPPLIIDPAVGGRVDFQYVDGIARRDFLAGGALPAGSPRGALGAVEGFGKNPGGGGFAHSSRAREDIPVRNALGEDGIFQRVGDQPLANHLIKDLRPILAGYNLVGHGQFWILDFRFWIGA